MSEQSGRSDDASLPTTMQTSVIADILAEEDLYKVIGASRSCTSAELRRCYLERSKMCHPDKVPDHIESTSAFQRLGFAFEILKSPSSRRAYDLALDSTSAAAFASQCGSLNGERTFRDAVEAVLQEFLNGDFAQVRQKLQTLSRSYPNLMSEDVVGNVERSFLKIRELMMTTRIYALLIYIELGRIHRVQKQLMGLGYFNVVGRARLTVHLARVTLAVPVRVDRALKLREEKEWQAKAAGFHAAGLPVPEATRRAGILNERVSKFLEFIVGQAGRDDEHDHPLPAMQATATV